MKHLDAAATRAALPWGPLVQALLDMFELARQGLATAPPRSHIELPGGGTLLLMPAASADFTALKTVTVHVANAAQGHWPVVQGDVMLMDTRTGARRLMLDGTQLTARRTAALSVAGLTRLGRAPSRNMLLIGTGVQAHANAQAFISLWGIEQLWISSRSLPAAQALADKLKQEFGSTAPQIHCLSSAAESAHIAAHEADLIVSATSSSLPVLPTQIRPDASVVALGAYRADMAEAPPELVHQCTVAVDSLSGARTEAGDLIQADVDWSQVIELAHAPAQACPAGRPVLLKTVGHALWDLAAAELAWRLMGNAERSPATITTTDTALTASL